MARLVLALFALVALASVASATVENISVTTEGEGKTLEEAVNAALAQAIAKVHGKQLVRATRNTSIQADAKLSTDTNVNVDERYSATTNTPARGRQVHSGRGQGSLRLKTDSKADFEGSSKEQTTTEAVRGAVKSYRILDKHSSTRGWWVKVAVEIPNYVQDAAAQRVRLAVVPLRIAKESFTWGNKALPGVNVKRDLTQQLSRQLVQSEKFTVLDREFDAEMEAEADMIANGKTPTASAARMGQQLAADYVLVGTVDDISMKTKERVFRASKRTIRTVTASAKVSFRLVNATTRQMVASDTVNVSLNNDDIRSGHPSRLYEAVAKGIVKKILDRMYPITLISVDGKNVVIGEGGATVSSGDVYKVYKLGRELVDPHTHEVIGRQESYCCEVRIKHVMPRYANAVVIGGPMDLAREFQPGRFIVREEVVEEATHEDIRQAEREERDAREAIRKRREDAKAKREAFERAEREAIRKRREATDDDW